MTPAESARGSECRHVWSRRCDYLYGQGVHYICAQCGHSNTYLRLKVTEKEAQASILECCRDKTFTAQALRPLSQSPYFNIDKMGWVGKFEAGETVELGIVRLIGRPSCLNWGRIPPEGFPQTFSCEHALFWSESSGEAWKGSVLSGEVWIDDPSFVYWNWSNSISHFAVFNVPRRDDDHQEPTEK